MDNEFVENGNSEEITEVVNGESTENSAVETTDNIQENVPVAEPVFPSAQGEPPFGMVVTPPKKKKFYKKWWFWLIIVVAVIAIAGIASSGDSGSSGSSGSSYVPTINPYVSMVKNATHSTYGITYGNAFENFFSNTDWSYFTSTDGLNVVEFEGDFYYSNSPATAKIQFVVDVEGGTFSAQYLSINDVSQSRLMLATLIQKVFESYYS